MQPVTRSATNDVLAARRRASKEVTEGIEEEIEELHVLSSFKRSCEGLLFVLLYATGVVLAFRSSSSIFMSVTGTMLMGIALNTLGILIHDGLHGLLAKNRHVNHLLSFLVGLPLGMSATAYQVTHTNHHFHLGRKRDYGTYRQHLRSPHLVWLAYCLQLFFGTILYVIFIPPLALIAASRKSQVFIVLEYCVIGTVYIFMLLNVPVEVLLTYWIHPLIVMTMLTNLRGLGSHALGDVENIYLSSRTIKDSKLVTALFLHENYHLEHHLFPGVPSYNLSKVHGLIWSRLPKALYSESYVTFLWSFLTAAMRQDLTPMGVVFPTNENAQLNQSDIVLESR